jgi:hypothetical protein
VPARKDRNMEGRRVRTGKKLDKEERMNKTNENYETKA